MQKLTDIWILGYILDLCVHSAFVSLMVYLTDLFKKAQRKLHCSSRACLQFLQFLKEMERVSLSYLTKR